MRMPVLALLVVLLGCPADEEEFSSDDDTSEADDDTSEADDDTTLLCVATVPGDFDSLQEAIDGSANGDVVCAEPGTYHENLDFGGKEVHLVGLGGPGQIVLDGDGYPSWWQPGAYDSGAYPGAGTSSRTGPQVSPTSRTRST